jgi:predicted enzyme related to lactoylglutathione lyase
VIIEIEPMAFDAQARVALVRDPSGAGFTLYEGPDLTVSSGTRRYHHVPDVTLIEGFYRDLFGWTFEEVGQNPWPVYDIRHRHGDLVAQVEEVPETIRGKFRYWMPCFTVPEPQTFLDKLTLQGGNVQTPLDEDRWMVSDRQGAAFMIRISS